MFFFVLPHSIIMVMSRKRRQKGIIMNTDKTFAEHLAAEYAPKDTSKIIALRKLDRRAKLPASVFAYTFGIAAALVMGAGMCLSMGVIGGGTAPATGAGVIIGILGITMAGVNYPLYKRILASGKRKYAEDIVRLAEQIAA